MLANIKISYIEDTKNIRAETNIIKEKKIINNNKSELRIDNNNNSCNNSDINKIKKC